MSKPLHLMPYAVQSARWPTHGRHILAQFDDESIIVYQAYSPAIREFAASNDGQSS